MKSEDIPLLLVGVAGLVGGGYLLWKYVWPQGEPCTPEGDTKCVGTTLMTCEDGKWVVTEKDSPECQNGPEPTEMGNLLAGYW